MVEGRRRVHRLEDASAGGGLRALGPATPVPQLRLFAGLLEDVHDALLLVPHPLLRLVQVPPRALHGDAVRAPRVPQQRRVVQVRAAFLHVLAAADVVKDISGDGLFILKGQRRALAHKVLHHLGRVLLLLPARAEEDDAAAVRVEVDALDAEVAAQLLLQRLGAAVLPAHQQGEGHAGKAGYKHPIRVEDGGASAESLRAAAPLAVALVAQLLAQLRLQQLRSAHQGEVLAAHRQQVLLRAAARRRSASLAQLFAPLLLLLLQHRQRGRRRLRVA
eukprot:scaffold2618_cov240-Pinguiococcus_pyrenoidosus.AAC.16